MADPVESGWERSAAAWIAAQGEHGDFVRKHVLDAAMMARVKGRGFADAIDIGCGEGRFARLLGAEGISTLGIDPAPSLIAEAQRRDPAGEYRVGRAEALDAPHASFDLAVSYLSLIDIEDMQAAIAEMARVLKPGGMLLIANLTSFNTAGADRGWIKSLFGRRLYYPVDRYLSEHAISLAWKGIRITNWHRPLNSYMQALIGQGMRLTWFDEPAPNGGDAETVAAYIRAPYAHVMEWRKDQPASA